MTSIVFLMEKNGSVLLQEPPCLTIVGALYPSEIASFATKIKLAPKEPFHCVAT